MITLHGEGANTVVTLDRFHCMERVKYSGHSRQVPLHGEGEIQWLL